MSPPPAFLRPLPPPAIRVVLADDHPLVLAGMRAFFSAAPEIEIVAAELDGVRALAAIRALEPEVAVLDIQMPGLSGIGVANHLKEERSRVALVAFSVDREPAVVVSAFEAGITGFVLKGIDGDELIRAVRAVSRGETYLSPCHAGYLMGTLRGRAPLLDALPPELLCASGIGA